MGRSIRKAAEWMPPSVASFALAGAFAISRRASLRGGFLFRLKGTGLRDAIAPGVQYRVSQKRLDSHAR